MSANPVILVVDDNAANVDILKMRLAAHGYSVLTASDGEQALTIAREAHPDLILLDIMMPRIDGLSVCRELKADESLPFMPIILITAKTASEDMVRGLEAGADEYLTKPVNHPALLARVNSMLRIKALHDQTLDQSRQLAEWNRKLEQRVAEQVNELERFGRLKRFFSPQLAELIVAKGGDEMLECQRREISVVFCDLRGFTAFSEAAEPEKVMEALGEYYAAMGGEVFRFEGTRERFVGDMSWHCSLHRSSVRITSSVPSPCHSRCTSVPWNSHRIGAAAVTRSESGLALRPATPPSARSGSKVVSSTVPPGRWQISPPACAMPLNTPRC